MRATSRKRYEGAIHGFLHHRREAPLHESLHHALAAPESFNEVQHRGLPAQRLEQFIQGALLRRALEGGVALQQ